MTRKTISDWLTVLSADSTEGTEVLRALYGEDTYLLAGRRDAYRRALIKFEQTFGDREVFITRAPGRLNLMGRHVDHRGGHVNPIALNLETLLVAEPRQDDRVVCVNVEEEFPLREFSIQAELPPTKVQSLQEWDQWTFEKVRSRDAHGTGRQWSHYVEAACVYFQDVFRDGDTTLAPAFCGLNLVALGDIPRSAGLSSSSALFVATAEALLALHGLMMDAPEFIEHCGRGEWYVGTRGGSGDHAAMCYGRKGHISHIGFHPSTVEYYPFPESYRVVIANSRDEAHKGGTARSQFNHRVACYEIGLMMIKENFPEYAPRLERLRDVSVAHLGISLSRLYEILFSLPDKASRDDLRRGLRGEHQEQLEGLFAKHNEPANGYPIRRVCLFGLAECERSRLCVDYLARGDMEGFGRLMQLSHDGDRVVCWHKGKRLPFDTSVSDAKIVSLRDAALRDQEGAALLLQPGGYECSTERIDELVDLAMSVEGVVGAQLSGAGLGGCMMAVVESDRVPNLLRHLETRYYRKHNLPTDLHVCIPCQGAGLVTA